MWGRTFLVVSALFLCATLAFAGPRKISKDLASKTSGNINVIVQFNHVPGALDHQRVAGHGGKLKRQLGHFRGAVYTVSAERLAELANDPNVAYVSPDRPVQGASTSSTAWNLDYHNETINAPSAWAQGLNGTGIGVAVIDSGIANVPDLNASNIAYSQDFTGDSVNGANDVYGHGTHVAGIIAGNGSQSTGGNNFYTFKGVAQNASIVNLRVLDANGNGTVSNVIAAIQTAIQLKDTYNIKVINLSLGGPIMESYTLDPLCQAVEQAWQAGITVVVAAGNYGRDNNLNNNGYGTITSPGNDPYVITVGAMNTESTADRTDDVIASYSSKGPTLGDAVVKPDLVAPGNLIVSLYTPTDTINQENPGNEAPTSLYQTNGTAAGSSSYFILSGTSMATPMVSGAAALLLQQNPNLTPDQVKATLMFTAYKGMQQYATVTDPTTSQTFDEQADIFTVGAGELDIQAALANTTLAPATVGSAMSPSAVPDGNGNIVLVANGPSVLGNNSESGNMILWGTNGIWGNMILWGTGTTEGEMILWGTDSMTSDMILWGTNATAGQMILWGTGTAQADMILWGTGTDQADMILWGTDTTSSSMILWGTGTTSSDMILWGTGTTGTPSSAMILWGTTTTSSADTTSATGSAQVNATSVLWGSKN
jgi:serine protease AprX